MDRRLQLTRAHEDDPQQYRISQHHSWQKQNIEAQHRFIPTIMLAHGKVQQSQSEWLTSVDGGLFCLTVSWLPGQVLHTQGAIALLASDSGRTFVQLYICTPSNIILTLVQYTCCLVDCIDKCSVFADHSFPGTCTLAHLSLLDLWTFVVSPFILCQSHWSKCKFIYFKNANVDLKRNEIGETAHLSSGLKNNNEPQLTGG